MSKHKKAASKEAGTLIDDARTLMTATADVAGDQIAAARQRVSVALEKAQEMANRVRERAIEGATATDEAVHAHPYKAIALGVGVGALLGFLIARRD